MPRPINIELGGTGTNDGTINTPKLNLTSATSSTVGAAGAASALPATPLGYVLIYIGGVQVKIPYYNV